MSFHHDYARWLYESDPKNCPVCNQAPMPEGMVDVIELPNSWLDAEPLDCLKGACSVVAKVHAVELYDLNDQQLLELMKEVQVYARALKTVTEAVKINYEIHGNTAPHLHVHLYPRYLDDPFPGRCIDYSQKADWYGQGGFGRFIQALKAEIERLL